MALFEIIQDAQLVAFRRLLPGAELYEERIEELIWANIEEITGQALFPVRRQAPIRGGGRPDIVCLDKTGAVVVIEVKRAIDRAQLAQCLEYAGWARTTNLDEIAKFYHRGAAMFWDDWTEFTGTAEPVLVNRNPVLIVTAGAFDDRSGSAVQFLVDNGLPIKVITTTLYQDTSGRTFLDTDFQGESLGTPTAVSGRPVLSRASNPVSENSPGRPPRATFQVSLTDLIGAGVLQPDEVLLWHRPRSGQTHTCTVRQDGTLQTDDGRIFTSLSSAASHVTGGGSFDGWATWRASSATGMTLKDLRSEFLLRQSRNEDAGT